jgi:hypothetical protein
MKRKIGTALLLSNVLLLSVGCSDNKESVSNTEIASEVESINQEEVYKIHEELLPEIKNLFNKYGFEYKELEDIDNEYYSGIKGVRYKITDGINPGDIHYAEYKVGISVDGEAKCIYANIGMDVDPDEIKANGFKMEDTFFADIYRTITGQDVDYTDVNEEIYEAYNKTGFLDSIKEYGNTSANILADGSMLTYTIRMYPENQ